MMTRLFSRLTLVTLLLSPMTLAQDDLASWEQAYNQVLASDEQRALAMLQDRYNALSPSIEKLYVSSKIHGFMILRGQPYHGNQIPHQEPGRFPNGLRRRNFTLKPDCRFLGHD